MKKNHVTLTIGAILVIIFGFMLLTYQVRHTEVAIRTTFGKANENNIGEGFHFRFPWPIDEVYKFAKRIQSSEWTFEETGTIEAKPVLVKVFVTWKISEALKFFYSFSGDMAKANEALEGKVRSAQNAVIGKYAFNNLVTTNEEELKLDAIEAEMKTRVGIDSKDNGIEIIMVGIKRHGKTAEELKAEGK
jgi:membrane protease subunit HflC